MKFLKAVNQKWNNVKIVGIGIRNIGVTNSTDEATENLRVEIERLLEQDQCRDVFNWLCRGAQSFQNEESHIYLSEKYHEGTCRGFFDSKEFTKWRNGGKAQQFDAAEADHPLLWIHGAPGVGKSVLMAQIVNELQKEIEEGEAIFYLYCSYQQREQQKLTNMLMSMAHQAAAKILVQTRSISPELLSEHAIRQGSQCTLGSARTLLSSLMKKFKKCYIALDGLDEYVHSDQDRLEDKLEILDEVLDATKESAATTRFIVSSRANLKAFAAGYPGATIEIEAAYEDIESYVEHSLQSSRRFRLLALKVPSYNEEVQNLVQRISRKASNQFLLAKLCIEKVHGEMRFRDMLSAAEKLPDTISAFYKTTLEQIRIRGQMYSMSGLHVLEIVLSSRRPLSVTELEQALAVDEGDEKFSPNGFTDDIFVHTGGLLSETRGYVFFAHQTVVDLFQTPEIRCTYFPFSEKRMANICMTYLCFQDFEKAKIDWEVPDEKFAFLRYAALYVGHHCTNAIAEDREEMLPKIKSFIKSDIPLGSLQMIATRTIQTPRPSRVAEWREKITDLHLAVVLGMNAIVSDLLKDKKTDPEARATWKNETPLQVAARVSNLGSTELLLAKNVNINATSWSGKTALDMILYGPYTRILNDIVQAGLLGSLIGDILQLEQALSRVPGLADPRGEIEKLIAAEVTANREKFDNMATRERSLDEDIETRRVGILIVLSVGIRIDLAYDNDDAAEEVAIRLIEGGIDPNSQGIPEMTPLQLAVLYGRERIVEKLLEYNANPFIDRDLGLSPLKLAKEQVAKSTAKNTRDRDKFQKIERMITERIASITDLEVNATDDDARKCIPGRLQATTLADEAKKNFDLRTKEMNKYVQNAMRERINDVPTIVEVMAMFQQAVASIAIASRTDQTRNTEMRETNTASSPSTFAQDTPHTPLRETSQLSFDSDQRPAGGNQRQWPHTPLPKTPIADD